MHDRGQRRRPRPGVPAPESAPRVVDALIGTGRAELPNGHQVRLAVFASVTQEADPHYLTISLGHILRFMRWYIDEHWDVLRHAEGKDAALGFSMTVAKAERAQMP